MEACDKTRILVVDDEPSVLKAFQMILSEHLPDCKIDLAGNGIEAFKHFLTSHHSVILMDLHMPLMDGEGAFREIKDTCRLKEWEMPSVIFCTAYDPSGELDAIIKEDPKHSVLKKPVDSQTLIDQITPRLN